MTVATIPLAVLPLYTVPARIAIQQHWPAQANSISLRRPRRSKIQIGGNEEKK